VTIGVFVVAAICVPSYLWLEPGEAAEEVGWTGVVAALLAIAIWGTSILRGVRLGLRSREWLKRHAGTIESGVPVLAMAGIFKPRLVVSRAVQQLLTADELVVAMRHEVAHHAAADNLKRLLIALAPGLLPGWHGFGTLERNWQRFAEWAADDDAVDGDNARSLALASALVRMARLRGVSAPLAAGLLDGDDLAARVDRLLHPRIAEPWNAQPIAITAAATVTAAASIAAVAMRPASLESAHRLLEQLIR
jgi:beta-lactamase regulating signal transducer with metallopeptidase domain